VTDLAWVALSLIRGMGTATLTTLTDTFGGARAVLDADDAALLAVPRVGKKTLTAVREIDLNAVSSDLDRWQAAGVHTIPFATTHYPAKLLPPMPDPPAVLFMRGSLPDGPSVAIVGTRRPSEPMSDVAYRAGRLLAGAGYVVVSGLAYGVDAAAHRGALSIASGRTLAVLGSGVLRVYPPEHESLAAEIIERGALLCEVSPEVTVSTPWLVARNRLISGLADAVLVVESAEDGGAMHTARAAYKQGRRLLAIDNDASGNRSLIDGGHAAPLPPDLSTLADLLS